MLSSIDWYWSQEGEAVAGIHAASTALAIERFRLKNGTLPGALGELVPTFLNAIPQDPFAADLHYKKLPVGYRVYSVGSDSIDHGGLELRTRDRGFGWFVTVQKPHDITFTVER